MFLLNLSKQMLRFISHRSSTNWSGDTSVVIETDYGLDGRGSIPGRDRKVLSSP
jgi:hypothetical protein